MQLDSSWRTLLASHVPFAHFPRATLTLGAIASVPGPRKQEEKHQYGLMTSSSEAPAGGFVQFARGAPGQVFVDIGESIDLAEKVGVKARRA